MKKWIMLLMMLPVSIASWAQFPTDVDVDTGRRDISIWDNPLYIGALVAVVVAAVVIIRWNRKR